MGRRTGIPPKVGPLRVGEREKGPVRVGTITKGVTDKENTREEKNAPQACTTHPRHGQLGHILGSDALSVA